MGSKTWLQVPPDANYPIPSMPFDGIGLSDGRKKKWECPPVRPEFQIGSIYEPRLVESLVHFKGGCGSLWSVLAFECLRQLIDSHLTDLVLQPQNCTDHLSWLIILAERAESECATVLPCSHPMHKPSRNTASHPPSPSETNEWMVRH